jgi:hypothetical protein
MLCRPPEDFAKRQLAPQCPAAGHLLTSTFRASARAIQACDLFNNVVCAGEDRFRLADLHGSANPRQACFASPVGVRPSSARGGTVFGANEAQVPDDFIAAAVVRRMVDAIDHRHVGKIKRAHAF